MSIEILKRLLNQKENIRLEFKEYITALPNNFVPFTKNPSIAKFFIQLGRGDELGSGVLNINKLINRYTKGGVPQFIEGASFKVIIPLKDVSIENKLSISNKENIEQSKNEGAIEGAVEGAVEGATKEKLKILLTAISNDEGNRIPYYSEKISESNKNIERYIKLLKEAGLIEFRGKASQTGGYYLTDDLLSKIKKE